MGWFEDGSDAVMIAACVALVGAAAYWFWGLV